MTSIQTTTDPIQTSSSTATQLIEMQTTTTQNSQSNTQTLVYNETIKTTTTSDTITPMIMHNSTSEITPQTMIFNITAYSTLTTSLSASFTSSLNPIRKHKVRIKGNTCNSIVSNIHSHAPTDSIHLRVFKDNRNRIAVNIDSNQVPSIPNVVSNTNDSSEDQQMASSSTFEPVPPAIYCTISAVVLIVVGILLHRRFKQPRFMRAGVGSGIFKSPSEDDRLLQPTLSNVLPRIKPVVRRQSVVSTGSRRSSIIEYGLQRNSVYDIQRLTTPLHVSILDELSTHERFSGSCLFEDLEFGDCRFSVVTMYSDVPSEFTE